MSDILNYKEEPKDFSCGAVDKIDNKYRIYEFSSNFVQFN